MVGCRRTPWNCLFIHLPGSPPGCSAGCPMVHLGIYALMRPPEFFYRSSTDLALRYVALIIQKMFSIFPRNQAKQAYGKKRSIIHFIPVETNYLSTDCGLAANYLLFPGCHLACVLWVTARAGDRGEPVMSTKLWLININLSFLKK